MIYTRFEKELIDIYERDHPPDASHMIRLIEETNNQFTREDPLIRPRDNEGLPGGIIYLNRVLPSILVPDIHARMDFLLSVLLRRDDDGTSVLDRLFKNEIQLICLGDGMHSEGRAYDRWNAAVGEFVNNYREHRNMDDEMRESLGVMEIVMRLKTEFPENFHFLKGNHENITNEEGNGNHPYIKYAFEGNMVSSYLELFYGPDFISSYYQFERNLPLLVAGNGFLASHAEPAGHYSREEIINYRAHPAVVEGLTWTDNDAAEYGSVAFMMAEHLGIDAGSGLYFGGHRPIDSLYEKRADGKYIQINNPDKFIIAKIDPMRNIKLEEDIMEIDNSISQILDDYYGL
ncbi:MAG: hypothetical protein CVV44_20750 [Spirochaetae bacterium HGW-Spirochaetae-1]|jgi:hypothetical protein|nr:MAG: hypothetical protein CVV44_20750 [Spirochaetae bacterium HGW-Spirochaetae-1]